MSVRGYERDKESLEPQDRKIERLKAVLIDESGRPLVFVRECGRGQAQLNSQSFASG